MSIILKWKATSSSDIVSQFKLLRLNFTRIPYANLCSSDPITKLFLTILIHWHGVIWYQQFLKQEDHHFGEVIEVGTSPFYRLPNHKTKLFSIFSTIAR